MPTTAQLRVQPNPQFANALIVHGIREVLVDHPDLVGYNFGGSRTGVLALSRVDLSYTHEIDLRKSTIEDHPCSFTITDYDGTLGHLFAAVDDTERQLGDVPLGAGLPIAPNDTITAPQLFDKHIGTERIGPAGERPLYPAPS